jgi:hypothetical protein
MPDVDKALVQPLVQALQQACAYETLDIVATTDRIQLLGRQPAMTKGIFHEIVKAWSVARAGIKGAVWSFDCSIYFFLPEGAPRVRHAYRVIIMPRGADIPRLLGALAAVATNTGRQMNDRTRPAAVELMEFTLGPAATPGRHSHSNGRGAGPSERTIPAALRQRR